MVIEQLRKEEIIEKTGAMPGSKTFIERYQTTLTAVMASLSKEELDEAQNTAIKWSAKTPPAAVQVDFAKKKAPGLMKDLASKLWKQAGMRIFILLAWKEEDEVHINGQQPKASVPWASVRKAQGDFIAAKFVPTGWKLDDPSKIWLADADRLLELWCQRQKDHVRPTFEFKGWEGDDKTMREPAEATSGKGSDTRCKNPVKKHTGKHTRRVEQELSSEDKEKDGDEEKDDNKEKDDDDDNGTSPPPKSKPVKKCLPVKKSRPVNARSTSPATSAAEHEDPRPPVKKFRQVLLPPKSKPTKKRGRVGHTQSDLESDSQSPRKKSKPNNASTGSVQSTGHRDNHPPPSKSRAFDPTSDAHGKKKNHKGPVLKPKATSKKATGHEAQTTDHEPNSNV
ncbi:hypothetical protein BDR03DRAFT_1018119 [Suillus americanus]|nr:hypothetical protein BDR03DRAFT_1018119 [Suillus americanus]